MRGKLKLVPRRSTGTQRVFEVQYAGSFLATGADAISSPGPAALEALRMGVQRQFYAVYLDRGELQELRFERTVPRLVQTTIRSLMTAIQLVSSGAGNNALWQVRESDGSGVYLAQYARKSTTITDKTKLRYLENFAKGAETSVLSSAASFGVDKNLLRSIDFDETVAVVTSSAALPNTEYQSNEKVHLKFEQEVEAPPSLDFEQRFAQCEPLLNKDSGTATARQNEFDVAMAGDLTEADALAMLHRVLANPDNKARDQALRALTALIRLDSKNVPPLVDHIRHHGPLTKFLIAALRDGGSVEAQAALRDLINDRNLESADRMDVARGLSLVAHPTPQTTRALMSLQQDPVVGVQASFGVGSNIYRLQGSDAAMATEAFSDLKTRLLAASTKTEQGRYLTALGSAGYPETVAAVAPYLSSDDQTIRTEAIDALRRVPGASVDQILSNQLMSGSDQVRMAAADAIRDRAQTPVLDQTFVSALTSEKNPEVKNHVLQAASIWVNNPDVRAAIQQIAQKDPSASVRQTAQAVLGSK